MVSRRNKWPPGVGPSCWNGILAWPRHPSGINDELFEFKFEELVDSQQHHAWEYDGRANLINSK
jgi:hypothetical protein